MEVQLSIRHNLPAEGDVLGAARVERFAAGQPLSVGAAADCDCRIADAEAFSPHHFELRPPEGRHGEWTVQPGTDSGEFFLNGRNAGGGERIRSGDEFRVGHWTLQFHRVPTPGEYRHRPDWAAGVNRLLVTAVLVCELAVILWLPQHLQSSSLWETGRLRQDTALAIDALRRELKHPEGEEGSTAAAAYEVLAAELDRISLFLHKHSHQMGRDQWQEVRRTVEQSRRIKDRIDQGVLLQPLPKPDLATAVQAVLSENDPPSPPASKDDTP